MEIGDVRFGRERVPQPYAAQWRSGGWPSESLPGSFGLVRSESRNSSPAAFLEGKGTSETVVVGIPVLTEWPPVVLAGVYFLFR